MVVLQRRLLPAFLGACLAVALPARAEPLAVSIATGGVTGVYYQIGAAICRLLRDHPPAQPIQCTTEGTAGSIRNLIDLRYGEARVAVVQADSLYDAVRGEGPFAPAGPDRGVRAMFTVTTDTLNVLVRSREAVTRPSELLGRRLNIGAPGSGTEVTFRRLMAERGWSAESFAGFTDFRSPLQAEALCNRRTDAIVFVSANPSGPMQDATTLCSTSLVPIREEFVRAMAEAHPFYVEAVIPGGTYAHNPDPIPTIGVRATLVASVDAPDELVYAITKAVLDHLEDFRTLHLAFQDTTLEEITRHCVFAPLHAGTRQYLIERGIAIDVCPAVSAAAG